MKLNQENNILMIANNILIKIHATPLLYRHFR